MLQIYYMYNLYSIKNTFLSRFPASVRISEQSLYENTPLTRNTAQFGFESEKFAPEMD